MEISSLSSLSLSMAEGFGKKIVAAPLKPLLEGHR